MSRKTHISECSPRWIGDKDGHVIGVSFECPEADGGCQGRHAVPTVSQTRPCWGMSGDLSNLTVTPSVHCHGACRMHITISGGRIDYASDSKSGPDWSAP